MSSLLQWAARALATAALLSSTAGAQGRPTDPDFAKASTLLGSGDVKGALELIDGVLARDPDEPWGWYLRGSAYYQMGRYDMALQGHMLSLVQAQPRGRLRAAASYNIACIHALEGRNEASLQWLHRARLGGYTDAPSLLADDDLKGLRDDPRFQHLGESLAIGSLPGARAGYVGGTQVGGTGGVACGPDGTLFISDFQSTLWRQAPGAAPEVLAEGFVKAAGSVLEPDGSILQVDFGGAKVWRVRPDGAKEDLGFQGLQGPVGVARAEDGTLYLTDFHQRAVLRVRPGGQPEVLVAGTMLKGPNGICLAPTGDLYVCNFEDGAVLKVSPEGRLSFVAELPGGGNGHLVWREGELFVTARMGHAVYAVTPAGVIRHVVGSGVQGSANGIGRSAQLALPNGIALGPEGKTFFVNDQVAPGQFRVRSIRLR